MDIPMSEFTDLHTHILPNTDDGAADLSQAISMLELAWKDGTRRLFLTPHCCRKRNVDPDTLRHRITALQSAAQTQFPGLEIYSGCEISFFHEAPELLSSKTLLTLADSRFVLVEFSSSVNRTALLSGLGQLLDKGFYPVLAHCERYAVMTVELARDLTEQGILLQVNADSILGKLGLSVKRLCRNLLKDCLVFCVASDAHDCFKRPPLLRKCFAFVAKKYGISYAKMLFDTNPKSILE